LLYEIRIAEKMIQTNAKSKVLIHNNSLIEIDK